MRLLKVGAATLNQTPLDWANNQSNILSAIQEAQEQEVSILCLPELCITGYGCEDTFLSSSVLRTSLEVVKEIVPASKDLIVNVGLPIRYKNAIFNTACLLCDGEIVGFTAKRYLARSGIHYEPRWFQGWPKGKAAELNLDGDIYHLGDVHFDCGGVRIGFEICEDAWVADRPGGGLSLDGVDVIMNPSASHFAFGKHAIRERFVLEASRAFGVTYLYSNMLGNEAGRAIYDGGAMVASGGHLDAVTERFSFKSCEIATATIDLDQTRLGQAVSANSSETPRESTSNCISTNFQYPKVPVSQEGLKVATWEHIEQLKEEEFSRAVSLGLFDYLRKSQSKGFVVSLSGGADSSAVTCLVAIMVNLAVKQLGIDIFKNRLVHIKDLTAKDTRGLIKQLLTCVYQSTRNSSECTKNSASGLALAIGAEFLEFDVDLLVENYQEIVAASLGRELTWESDDISLQNIQARVRSPGIWLVANLKQALLLSTSNRSEAAVGYATMDGDTSGGLSPIAGIDKAFLCQWLRWAEKEGPAGLESFSALGPVNDQEPSAELRPKEHRQTDEEDLMPYPLLDAIERAAIRDKKDPLEVFSLMEFRFPAYGSAQLARWIERFFVLWSRNQWKRERYAPSFHLDDENLDPKTWCRFPILSGGFKRELEELSKLIND